jgi:hypothetical protein
MTYGERSPCLHPWKVRLIRDWVSPFCCLGGRIHKHPTCSNRLISKFRPWEILASLDSRTKKSAQTAWRGIIFWNGFCLSAGFYNHSTCLESEWINLVVSWFHVEEILGPKLLRFFKWRINLHTYIQLAEDNGSECWVERSGRNLKINQNSRVLEAALSSRNIFRAEIFIFTVRLPL